MATIVNDTFTGADGTALASHTGETGATWTAHPSYSANMLLSNANRARSNAAGALASVYYASGVPAIGDYSVETVIRAVSLPGTGVAGVNARLATGADTYWQANYNLAATRWELYKSVAGSVTLIASVTQTLTVGNDYTLRLVLVSGNSTTQIHALVNDAVIMGLIDNAITATGRAGICGYGAFTNAAGLHNDRFLAQDMKVLVCDGDSITVGTPSTPYTTQIYPTILSPWQTINKGVGGQTLANMISDAATDIDSFYHASHARNICVCFGGTNDVYFNADGADDTGATTYGRMVTYCQARQAAGWQVIIVTMLPRSEFTTSTLPAVQQTHFNSRRAAINTSIRANWATFADAIADIAANTDIGEDGDSNNGTYYLDLVHPTTAGQAIIAGIIGAAEQSLDTPPPAPSITSVTPDTGQQGSTNLSLAVLGTNFVSGAVATFSGAGITVDSIVFNSSTSLTVTIDIAGGAALTARDLTITNPDTLFDTLIGGFTVIEVPPPPPPSDRVFISSSRRRRR